ncbi:MAG TPA: PspA/IM30 family protein [Kofleriaceae bacterium]|nr:PspA/IM30 family protein [Kofleriaceae bacterium]
MGIFSKISKKANAALDKAIDPEKQVDLMIFELEAQKKKALEELISYKATAKQMDQDIAKQDEKAAHWEQQAMRAVKAGNDELAKQALAEKKRALQEKARIVKDRDEALGYAVQLNRSRKAFETRLQILKLKKGTLATQLAASRSATGNVFGHDDEVWDRLERAAEKIDDEAIRMEVDAALDGPSSEADTEARIAALLANPDVAGALPPGPDDPLDQLKKKMADAKAAKKKG